MKNNTEKLCGKNVVITGSTGGLGRIIVKYLTDLGANFVLCNRDNKKSEQQREEILRSNPNAVVSIIETDLQNFESVKKCVANLKDVKIDYLLLNSGIYNVKRVKTDIGFDNVFQVNFLAPYYMIKQLKENIKNNNGRVVAVGSIAHNYSKINEKDIQFFDENKASKVYGNSKRFLMFSLFELAKRENINLSICHPGVTLTNMTNHYPKAINWLVKIGIKMLFPKPEKASLSIIKGLFVKPEYFQWVGPTKLNVWGKPKISTLKTCTQQESEKIFALAEEMYNKM